MSSAIFRDENVLSGSGQTLQSDSGHCQMTMHLTKVNTISKMELNGDQKPKSKVTLQLATIVAIYWIKSNHNLIVSKFLHS